MTSELITIANNNEIMTVDQSLDAMYGALEKSAAIAIEHIALEENTTLSDFSAIEQRAMLMTEMLSQSKAVDFAAVMLKGRIIDTLENESLHAAHPAGYTTLEELAIDQGIGSSELSNIRDLTRVVFPWIEEHMDMSAREVWDQVGKSNLRELVPVLKRIMTGDTARGTVERAYANLVVNMIATVVDADGPVIGDDDQGQYLDMIHDRLVEQLISDGGVLTNANLRQVIRPDRTQSIDAYIFHLPDGEHMLLTLLSDEQEQMMARRMHGYWDASSIRVNEDAQIRPTAGMRALLQTIFLHIDTSE